MFGFISLIKKENLLGDRLGALLSGPLVLNGSDVPLGYFSCVGCRKIALPNGFPYLTCDLCDNQMSDELPGEEDDELYGGNSETHNFFDMKNYEENCVSDELPGNEEEP